jgi:hypothetical protein
MHMPVTPAIVPLCSEQSLSTWRLWQTQRWTFATKNGDTKVKEPVSHLLNSRERIQLQSVINSRAHVKVTCQPGFTGASSQRVFFFLTRVCKKHVGVVRVDDISFHRNTSQLNASRLNQHIHSSTPRLVVPRFLMGLSRQGG